MERKTFVELIKKELEKDISHLGMIIEEDERIIRNDITIPILRLRKEGSVIGGELKLGEAYDLCESGHATIPEILPDLKEAVKEVVAVSMSTSSGFDIKNFDLSLEKIKPFLSIELFDTDMNRKYLERRLHRTILGGGLTIAVYLNTGENYRTFITDDMLEDIGATENEIIDAALENAIATEPASILFPHETGLPFPHNEDQAFVTTDAPGFGASVLAYPGILDDIEEKLNGSFFIMPIDRGTVTALSERLVGEPTGEVIGSLLMDTVTKAIEAHIPPEELLSFKLMHYNAENRELGVYSPSAQMMAMMMAND